MARKSNKTAHVLNLIAGHEAPAENTEEILSTEESSASPSAKPAPAAPAPAQNISVIDTTEEDPVADLIQQKLTTQFEETETDAEPAQAQTSNDAQEQALTTEETPAQVQTADTTPAQAQTSNDAQAQAQTTDAAQAQTSNETQAQTTNAAQEQVQTADTTPEQARTSNETQEQAQTTETTQVQAQTSNDAQEQVQKSDAAQEQAQTLDTAQEQTPEPTIVMEPDFVRVNVIEEIVKDKIIYFMRQFDVCTCEHCVQDTIALTLNGILPKYIVTTPAAVAPLLSFYTNRYITDVTVEATKACAIVKDNPRH